MMPSSASSSAFREWAWERLHTGQRRAIQKSAGFCWNSGVAIRTSRTVDALPCAPRGLCAHGNAATRLNGSMRSLELRGEMAFVPTGRFSPMCVPSRVHGIRPAAGPVLAPREAHPLMCAASESVRGIEDAQHDHFQPADHEAGLTETIETAPRRRPSQARRHMKAAARYEIRSLWSMNEAPQYQRQPPPEAHPACHRCTRTAHEVPRHPTSR